MIRFAAIFALSLVACSALHERTNMPRPPWCVRGGNAPVGMSMDDYGATYTPGMQRGPAPAVPDSYLVPERDAGIDCVAPPWWNPPEPDEALRATEL